MIDLPSDITIRTLFWHSLHERYHVMRGTLFGVRVGTKLAQTVCTVHCTHAVGSKCPVALVCMNVSFDARKVLREETNLLIRLFGSAICALNLGIGVSVLWIILRTPDESEQA